MFARHSARSAWVYTSALIPLTLCTFARAQAPVVNSLPRKMVRVLTSPTPPEDAKSVASASGPHRLAVNTPYPQPPLAGFSPLILLTTSDKHKTGELEWEHLLEGSYAGAALNPPANQNYVVGVFDSGSTADVIGYCDAAALGLTGSRLTGNTVTLQGASGTFEADITKPLGLFAAPLSAINENSLLDLTQVVGHTNNSMVVLPDETCGDIDLPSFIGTPLLSFYTTEIRNDDPQVLFVGGQPVRSPQVHMYNFFDVDPAQYPRSIGMTFGGLSPVTTSAFFGDFEDFRTPITPTQLAFGAGSIPTAGAFFGSIGVLQGTPGPTNPLQTMRVLIDTGAQSSIMSPGMAANLSLPLTPDFYVEVLGIGGVSQAPGYYIDYVKINAFGGALEFSRVPFVVLDIPSVDGQPTQGVLGMNFFWNRNIVFEPSLTSSGFLHVSNPLPMPARAIVEWRSIRSHSGEGDLPVVLKPAATGNGVSGPTVETRQGGIRKIEVDFDGIVSISNVNAITVTGYPTTNGVLGAPVNYLPTNVWLIDSDTLQIEFAANQLPDRGCYRIELGGGAIAEGIAGDNDCWIRSLYGDTSGNGEVAIGDTLATKTKINAGADTEPAHDVNLTGGLVNIGDALAIKARVTSPSHKALCP